MKQPIQGLFIFAVLAMALRLPLAQADTIPGRWELVESLKANTQINVKTFAGEALSGPFQRLEAEYLILMNESGAESRISKAQIREITRDKERERKFWTGTKIGALAGFGAGFIIGYVAGDDGIFYDFTAGFNGWVLGGLGAGAGAIIGYASVSAGRSPEILYKAPKR